MPGNTPGDASVAEGGRPVLVLCGGGPGMRADYLRPLVNAVARDLDYDIHEWTWRTDGGRAAITLAAQVAHLDRLHASLGRRPLILVCHSAAAKVGIRYVAERPGAMGVAGLILVAGLDRPLHLPWRLAARAYPALLLRLATHWHAGLDGAFVATYPALACRYYFARDERRQAARFQAAFARGCGRLLLRSDILRSDVRAALSSLAVPTLIVGGEDDRIVPPAHLGEQRERIGASAVLSTIASSGHFPMWEAEEATRAAIRRFMLAPCGEVDRAPIA